MLPNPELRRNIWLDFTWHRIILTPIVIGLIVYFFYLVYSKYYSASVAFNLACFFIFLWGTKRASETVIEEVNNNTWDFQRQSSISPWAMTWGKLIGSTLFTWYGAFICLLLYYFLSPNPSPAIGFKFSGLELTPSGEILLLILGGLFSQALALLLSMQLLPQIRRESFNRTFRYFIIGLIFGIIITDTSFQAVKEVGQHISWHEISFAKGPFAVTSLLIFLGWSVIGLQRSFCKELQYQNIPWVWALFSLFCMVYFSGFIPSQSFTLEKDSLAELKDIQQQFARAPLYMAFIVAQILTYVALFTESLNIVRYKKFFSKTQTNILGSLQLLPWWVISFILTIMAGIIAVFHQQQFSALLEKFSPSIFILTAILFLQRDILLIHYFNFSKNPRKAMGTSILYLFILYLLFPLLLGALHKSNWLPLFLPSWGQNTALALISTIGQILFLGGLCWTRWQLTWATSKS